MCMMVCPHGMTPRPAIGTTWCVRRCGPRPRTPCLRGGVSHWRARNPAPPAAPRPSESQGHVVVVGLPAGTCRPASPRASHAPGCSITLVTAGPPPRNTPARCWRTFLPAGSAAPADLLARGRPSGPCFVRGRACFSLPIYAILDDATQLTFDRLILATERARRRSFDSGGQPRRRPALRNLGRPRQIEKWPRPAAVAVVLGGRQRRLPDLRSSPLPRSGGDRVVTSPYLLSQMVDAEAGRRVADLFIRHGLTIRTGRGRRRDHRDGHVEGVRLDDGRADRRGSS